MKKVNKKELQKFRREVRDKMNRMEIDGRWMTRADLARELGVSRCAITQTLNGDRAGEVKQKIIDWVKGDTR